MEGEDRLVLSEAMKTLFLNPPSFENFDGGAGARWPATRETESFWYAAELTYPAGVLSDSKLRDAPPRKATSTQTAEVARRYDFVVVFTSCVGFQSDVRLARRLKDVKPEIKIAFVGPHVRVQPTESLKASRDIDFIVRAEFDHAVVEFARQALQLFPQGGTVLG